MNNIFTTTLLCGTLAAGLTLAACDQKPKGSAEAAGERLDSATEEMTQGHKDLTDGPMENAGEKMDKAAEDMNKAVDDMKDNTTTTP